MARAGRPPLDEGEAKSAVINLRVTPEVNARLDALVAKYPLTKHAVARLALERGLDGMESDPTWFVKEPPPKRGRGK